MYVRLWLLLWETIDFHILLLQKKMEIHSHLYTANSVFERSCSIEYCKQDNKIRFISSTHCIISLTTVVRS